jgi:hypothetical protein
MSNQRPSFAKREREMKLKDKARAKAERRAARKADPRSGSGPEIADTNEAMESLANDPPTPINSAPINSAPINSAPSSPAPIPSAPSSPAPISPASSNRSR